MSTWNSYEEWLHEITKPWDRYDVYIEKCKKLGIKPRCISEEIRIVKKFFTPSRLREFRKAHEGKTLDEILSKFPIKNN